MRRPANKSSTTKKVDVKTDMSAELTLILLPWVLGQSGAMQLTQETCESRGSTRGHWPSDQPLTEYMRRPKHLHRPRSLKVHVRMQDSESMCSPRLQANLLSRQYAGETQPAPASVTARWSFRRLARANLGPHSDNLRTLGKGRSPSPSRLCSRLGGPSWPRRVNVGN